MSILRRLFCAAVLALGSLAAIAGPVDINSATAEELAASLKGVGAAKAAAIVAYRSEHGPFQAVDDLTKVSGIGDKLMEANRSNMTVGASEAVAE